MKHFSNPPILDVSKLVYANEHSGVSLQKAAVAADANDHARSIDESFRKLMARYERSGRPVNVSFRQLVSWIKGGDRATHFIHPYPAKLLPHIAHFFLSVNELSRPGDKVLDPFGGSGTVALEAQLFGRRPLYADANPLAKLIATVKCKRIPELAVRDAVKRVKRNSHRAGARPPETPCVVNIEHWYQTPVIDSLGRIKRAIEKETDKAVKEFLLVAFSVTCRKQSNADPRVSVPVRLKKINQVNGMADVWETFEATIEANLRRMKLVQPYGGGNNRLFSCKVVGNDARSLVTSQTSKRPLANDSVDLIITSPPYAGAQKYIRASSLSLGWLGMASVEDLKRLENKSIGREHYSAAQIVEVQTTGIAAVDRLVVKVYQRNPLRSKIVSSYILEMRECIREMHRVLKPGGHMVMVLGNNEVCGYPLRTARYLREICEMVGMQTRMVLVDEIKSRGLMTKRNRTASVITREWVLVMVKPRDA
jgi:DNA modification methylase